MVTCFRGNLWLLVWLTHFPIVSGAAEVMNTTHLQGRWALQTLNGNRIETEIFFEIDGTKITGFDGCNNFGGRVDAPSRLVMSQRACASKKALPLINISEIITQLRSAKVSNSRMTVPLPGGGGEAEFERR